MFPAWSLQRCKEGKREVNFKFIVKDTIFVILWLLLMRQVKNDGPSWYILESLVALVLTINSLHSDEHCSLNRPTLMDELLSTLSLLHKPKGSFQLQFLKNDMRFYWYGHTIWRVASMKKFIFFIFNSFGISSENAWVSDSSFIYTYSLMLFHVCQTSAKFLGSHPPATTLYYSSKPCVFIYPAYFFISLINTQLRIISPFHGPPSSWLPTL